MKKEIENLMNKKPSDIIYKDENNIMYDHNYIGNGMIKAPNGEIGTADSNNISFEMYNNNDFTIVMENIHENKNMRYPEIIICKAYEHALIPHRYFIPHINELNSGISGVIDILELFGDDKGKNKIK